MATPSGNSLSSVGVTTYCGPILIGLEDIRGEPGEPIARLTPLGWTCVGAPSQIDPDDFTNNFIRTYLFQNRQL